MAVAWERERRESQGTASVGSLGGVRVQAEAPAG
jgi:hypothetical protein